MFLDQLFRTHGWMRRPIHRERMNRKKNKLIKENPKTLKEHDNERLNGYYAGIEFRNRPRNDLESIL